MVDGVALSPRRPDAISLGVVRVQLAAKATILGPSSSSAKVYVSVDDVSALDHTSRNPQATPPPTVTLVQILSGTEGTKAGHRNGLPVLKDDTVTGTCRVASTQKAT